MMKSLPEDITGALVDQSGLVRQYALEQALKFAVAATEALDADAQIARAHVTCMAQVSQAWSALAAALPGGL